MLGGVHFCTEIGDYGTPRSYGLFESVSVQSHTDGNWIIWDVKLP